MWSTGARLPAEPVTVRERLLSSGVPGTQDIRVTADSLRMAGLEDVRRLEVRVATARADWPFGANLSDAEIAIPGNLPTNVENGIGFVGGVARWTLPLHRCWAIQAKPNSERSCTTVFSARSASISGRVVRQARTVPKAVAILRLTERFPGGGAVTREGKSGWDDRYRFEGIEPGAELLLEFDSLSPAPAVRLPRLSPGQRYVLPDISVPVGCGVNDTIPPC
jgi:hypothetical protein